MQMASFDEQGMSGVGCESLKKLDFTANFIGELTSIETLQGNYSLEELYLTGNPCTEFEGYRDFVIATLPQLMILDGDKIKKSERIMALQKYHRTRKEILEQEKRYLKNVQFNNEDIIKSFEDDSRENANYDEDSREKFWKQPTKHTPLSRIEIYKHMEKSQKKNDSEIKKPKIERKLITDDGKILNVNEAKLDFEFIDDEENNCFKLNLAVYRFLDTSLVEADVQPNYVRVKVNGKYFQLFLPEEIHPDLSTSLRSQTTGHLLITMPKANGIIKERKFLKGNSNHRVAKEINKRSPQNVLVAHVDHDRLNVHPGFKAFNARFQCLIPPNASREIPTSSFQSALRHPLPQAKRKPLGAPQS
ncbi:protein tilB homolog [Trichonephila clavipes]|nr:protein tilB homolog [Trichonephila clavipes]